MQYWWKCYFTATAWRSGMELNKLCLWRHAVLSWWVFVQPCIALDVIIQNKQFRSEWLSVYQQSDWLLSFNVFYYMWLASVTVIIYCCRVSVGWPLLDSVITLQAGNSDGTVPCLTFHPLRPKSFLDTPVIWVQCPLVSFRFVYT